MSWMKLSIGELAIEESTTEVRTLLRRKSGRTLRSLVSKKVRTIVVLRTWSSTAVRRTLKSVSMAVHPLLLSN